MACCTGRNGREGIAGCSKKLSEDAEFIERLWLVKNGVPYDVAFDLPEWEALAHAVVFGMFEGQEFSWVTMQMRQRSS